MVREQRVESFYATLRQSAASSSSPLLIFPSTSDADSLCALKILFHVLESDSIRYSCYPVSSFREIRPYAGPDLDSATADSPISILLLNWGNCRDLRRVLSLRDGVRVFVVDSHRPVHLHNLSQQNDRVVVLYGVEDEHQADLVYDFDVSALANASDLNNEGDYDDDRSSDDDDEEEEESDVDEDGNRRRRKRRKVDEEEEEEDPVKVFRKLKREYYQMGTFHGKPSGCYMYELSHSLRKNTNELLWLACVSLTDQFVHERLTNERYFNKGFTSCLSSFKTRCPLFLQAERTSDSSESIFIFFLIFLSRDSQAAS